MVWLDVLTVSGEQKERFGSKVRPRRELDLSRISSHVRSLIELVDPEPDRKGLDGTPRAIDDEHRIELHREAGARARAVRRAQEPGAHGRDAHRRSTRRRTAHSPGCFAAVAARHALSSVPG